MLLDKTTMAVRKGLRIGFNPFRNNYGLQWVLTFPFVVIHWHRQREMWFRDLHANRRDECETLEEANRKLLRQLAQLRNLAAFQPDSASADAEGHIRGN